MKLPIGRFGILQPGPAAADGLADSPDGLGLRDDLLLDLVFHLEQAGRFLGLEPGERDAGHLADDLGDHFLIDGAVNFLGPFAPLAGDRFLLLLELVGLVAQGGGPLEVLVGDGLFLVLIEAFDLLVELLQVRAAGSWP